MSAFQVRCVNCKREQYMPAIISISEGNHPCVWCGYTPRVYKTEKEFWKEYDETKPYSFYKQP